MATQRNATQRLSDSGKRLLIALLVCTLWAFVFPASAQAQGWGTLTCTPQAIINPPMPPKYQLKCQGSVTGVGPPVQAVAVVMRVQTKPNAMGAWTDTGLVVVQYPNINMGTASFDSGWLDINPAPAPGAVYRFKLTGYYIKGPNPPQQIDLPTNYTNEVVPN
jgi:hypothetical protein